MTNLGQYSLHEELGRGIYATVYRATHSALGNQVAIKVLSPALSANDNARNRFYQESQAASALIHPNIVSILDLDEDNGQYFIIMEYIAGSDLKKRKLSPVLLTQKEMIKLLRQVAEALDYAHSLNIFHKDIKPSNILFANDGSVHICDFGLVGVAEAAKLGAVVGNAEYISPEQAEGKTLNKFSDQYSLAVVAYELFSCELPFKGDSSTATALLHVTRQPPNPSEINPQLPTEVSAVLIKALSKSPNERFGSCSEFIQTLASTLEDSQLRFYRELVSDARSALEKGDLGLARTRVESARKLLLDRPDLMDDFTELDNASQTAENYEIILENWKIANDEAKTVLELFPDYPDPEGIFEFLGLRKPGWVKPSTAELILQIGTGLVLGIPLMLLILFISFRWITK